MKRLIDEDNVAGSPSHLLAELVRATQRLEPDDSRKRRVLTHVRLAQRSARPRFHAAVAAVLLVSGSATAATVGRLAFTRGWFHEPSTELRLESAPTGPTAPAPRDIAAPILSASVEPLSAPVPMDQSAAAARPPVGSAARPEVPIRIVETPVPAASWSPAGTLPSTLEALAVPTSVEGVPSSAPAVDTAPVDSSHVEDAEDAAQVVEAIGALRNRGDGVRAGVLLAEYLGAHPTGVLAEDAIALSIEAAAARHDPSSAADYARRYLRQFPNGRFRAMAVRASKIAQH